MKRPASSIVTPRVTRPRDLIAGTGAFWIPSNHETDTNALRNHLWDSVLATQKLHGRVVDVTGHRIADLGGVFRGRIWGPPIAPRYALPEEYLQHAGEGNLWRGGLPRKHRSTIFPSDIAHLAEKRADLLVTHKASNSLANSAAERDRLAIRLGVHRILRGHHHWEYRARVRSIEAPGGGLRRGVTDVGQTIGEGEC
ncbi:hypothetical protein OPU71_21080 [Niveibacterium sp. 24ML]|uniref:hypothetical protein n=1 Tax=Niveibacterium sp. 24ML TaxID=2985512 RepID=UPI00226F2296|nr:hypothetical protein [Niveibacterium sp. 24ML]MCX9158615.1 hypothetical protein [Niveibacterium sp. 24ML]